jgi:hypothetical protein
LTYSEIGITSLSESEISGSNPDTSANKENKLQTFLPYPNFSESAACLDWRRLGKQRVEAYQIVNVLTKGTTGGWKNHPAVRMWRGHEDFLKLYTNAMIREWIYRGYKNNMLMYIEKRIINPAIPKWFGNESFHASHRSNLLRKDKEYYGQFGWTEPSDLPYVWPI